MRNPTMILLAALAACAEPQSDSLIWVESPPPAAPTLYLGGPNAAPVGGSVSFLVNGAAPGELIEVVVGTGVGEGPCAAATVCAAVTGDVRVAGTARANSFGNAVVDVPIPASAPLDRLGYFQAIARRGPGGVSSVVSNVERVRTNDGSARVRVVHASPGAPVVDIYANGALLVPGLDYLQASPFVSVPPGFYTIDVRPALADPSSTPVYSTDVQLVGDFDFTAVAAGVLGSTKPADSFRVVALVEDWSPPFPGAFYTRVVHASPDAPAVALDVGNDGSLDFFPLLRFGETGAAGIGLPADTSLQVAATTLQGVSVPFTLPAFSGDDDITVIATGRLAARPNEPDAFGLLALDRDGVVGFVRQNPQVYVLHASPDAPTVDVQAGGATLVDDLSFRELSAPVTVPPGVYSLDVFDTSGRTYVTSLQTPELAAGERYLAIATGFLAPAPGQAPFQAAYFADSAAIVPGIATLQIIHASPDAPTVQVGALSDGFVDLTGPLTFPNEYSRQGLLIGAGVYDIAVAQPFGPVLFEFPGLPLVENDRYFAIATGSVTAGSFGITMVDPTAQPWATITVAPAP
jgi:hypothetical protein